MVVASTYEHLRSTPACQSSKTKKRKVFFFCLSFSLALPLRQTENKLQWFLPLVMPVSCLCRPRRCVCVLALTPLVHRGGRGLAPLPPGHPPPLPPPKYKRSVILCFERHECVAVWASEMWEAVCSEACFFFSFFFEGLDRVGEGGRVANFFVHSRPLSPDWRWQKKLIKRWNKWTKTANYVWFSVSNIHCNC